MASKTITVSPAGAIAAGCSATCDSYYSGIKPPSYQGAETVAYTNYQVVATGVGNWRPKRIKVTHAYTYSDGTTGGQTITYRSSDYGDTNPWSFPAVKESSNWENPFEFRETDPGTVTRLRTVNDTITGVEVEFEESTPPTPTSYTITTAVTPAGSGTATGGGTFNSGATCTLAATPSAGYTFTHWTNAAGATVSTNATYSFTVTASGTYTAHFSLVVTAFRYGSPSATVYLNGVAENTRVGPGPGFPGIVGAANIGETVVLNVVQHDATFRFLNWTKLSAGDPWAAAGTVVATTKTATVTVREPGTRYRANFQARTHLLVNSSTAENPAKLVYDPATNLLVADY